MSRRRQVREVCVQVLYQLDLNPDVAWSYIDQYVRERLHGDAQRIAMAIERIQGVQRHQHEIDRRIASVATNWKLNRIAPVDRAILRLGAFEFLFEGTPGPVAINEAIELAKRFGDDQSPRFVNGILDSLYKANQPSGQSSNQPSNQTSSSADGAADGVTAAERVITDSDSADVESTDTDTAEPNSHNAP